MSPDFHGVFNVAEFEAFHSFNVDIITLFYRRTLNL